jgi:acyl carrier protein
MEIEHDEVRRLVAQTLDRPVEAEARLDIDSVDALRLVSALEQRFEIIVDDAELTPETFESVASLAELARRLATDPSARSSP